MRKCMDAANLHRRLAKIIGQVQAIDRRILASLRCRLAASIHFLMVVPSLPFGV